MDDRSEGGILMDIDEGHPIWKAIDRGGGQTCDVRGVLRVLAERGYTIVPKETIFRDGDMPYHETIIRRETS